MALFKCKMCGGDLEINEGASIAECEYCGTKQTVPKATDENLQNLFNRANTLRIKSEFDKAEKLYEKILQADTTQSEAYWGLILCKYGIEYVDDPATLKKVPTCHRASYESIIADDDYKAAIENADTSQRALYEKQAKEIDRIQKEILVLAQKEETYDVFICYKETDADGHRTQDSVIANDIYYQLTQEGFKVFYAAITLEGKLGSAYEPIIFAALNSAKVMLSIGTKPEYFNAVWVKNEWSRFLKIIKKDRSRVLIPCYRDMDAYELPEEFAHLQAQDMGKIGFIHDIVRGIKKVIKKDEPKTSKPGKETVVTNNDANVAPLLKRAFLFLEDSDWKNANDYCEKVLDQDPENGQAYLGKLLAELNITKPELLKDCKTPFDRSNNYQKAVRFGDESLKNTLKEYIDHVNEQAKIRKKDDILSAAKSKMGAYSTIASNQEAISLLKSIPGWRNADELIIKCQQNIAQLEEQAEAERLAKERRRQELLAAERAKRRNKIIVLSSSIGTVILGVIIWYFFIFPSVLMNNGDYKLYVEMYNVTELEIPDGTTTIQSHALSDCTKLTSVTIPDSVTSIGYGAFKGCSNLQSITIPFVGSHKDRIGNYNDIKDIMSNIQNSSWYFGYIFAYNINPKEADKADFAESVPESLKTVIITGGTIGYHAFYNCSHITSITISDNVTSVDYAAFEGCSSLEYNEFDNAYYLGNDSNPYRVLVRASSTTIDSCTINSDTVMILPYAFADCYNLTSVTIPDSVTNIGENAFFSCSSLESMTIPDSVTSIDDSAFEGCSSLESMTIPDSVTSIGYSAFKGCSSLATITIPDSVTSIGASAFKDCSGLENITLPFVGAAKNVPEDETDKTHLGYIFGASENSSNDDYVPKSLKTVTVTGGARITYGAFMGCYNLSSITIPDEVKSIGDSAFYGCSGLTNITIPDGVKGIGKSTFKGCSSLMNIIIPDGVKSIGENAFYGCSGLESITIPDSVTSIGYSAFYDCSSLASVTIPDGVTSIVDLAFYNCSGLTSITIPDGVKSIGQSTFKGCSSLAAVTIPNSITSIDRYAFSGCSSLTSITIPDSVTYIGASAFEGCSGLENITLPFVGTAKNVPEDEPYKARLGYIFAASDSSENDYYSYSYVPKSLKTVTITGGTSIVNLAFYNCSGLTSITIPDSVTSIGDSAFAGCSGLTSIIIPDSVTSIGGSAFSGCSDLTSITIPNSVTSIGFSAFANCSSLTSITIPDSITYINVAAFSNCSNLATITIPDSVTSIGGSAFSNCSNLDNITIPNSVTIIGSKAFKDCSKLTSVTFENHNGWKAGSTSLSELDNTSTAATYLKNTYLSSAWTRS